MLSTELEKKKKKFPFEKGKLQNEKKKLICLLQRHVKTFKILTTIFF